MKRILVDIYFRFKLLSRTKKLKSLFDKNAKDKLFMMHQIPILKKVYPQLLAEDIKGIQLMKPTLTPKEWQKRKKWQERLVSSYYKYVGDKKDDRK